MIRVKLITILLSISLTLVAAQNPTVEQVACSLSDRMEFTNSNLNTECRDSLVSLRYEVNRQDESQPFVPSLSDLDTVCQEDCAGVYTTWLRDTCDDPYQARMLEAMCVYTAETTDIGERCRFTFPDAVDDINGYFNAVFFCGLGVSPDSCQPGCRTSMNALINLLGCCYNSLYNNTLFIGYLQKIGLVNTTVASNLDFLGKVSEWQLCEVTVPPMCETLPFQPDNSMNDGTSSASHYSCLGFGKLVTLATVLLAVLMRAFDIEL